MSIRRASEFGSSEPQPSKGSRRTPRSGSDPFGLADRTREGDAPKEEKKPRRKKLVDMDHPEQVEAAKNTALFSLSASAKTRGQLETKLAEKGHTPEVIAEALDRLAEVGLIDDAAFAKGWVSSRHNGRGLSGSAIRRELRQKGVDDESIDAALEDLGAEDELERARELVARKLASTRNLPRDARVRRLTGMLARKGYGGGIAFSVVREALADETDTFLDSGEE